MDRRGFLAVAAAWGVAGMQPLASAANEWPLKPVKIVCPYPPGGIVDIIARLLGEQLSQSLGQPVIVESRAGAGGNIGTAYVARSRGDPYTLLLGASGPLAINVSLYDDLGYDVMRDLTPISLLAATPLVLVASPKSGISTVSQLLENLNGAGQEAFYGSAGVGTPQHLAGELFKQRTGTRAEHVAYKGGAPAVMALLSGEVLYAFENLALVEPHLKSGDMVGLASTGDARIPFFPELPTMMESGVADFVARGWYGLLAPADIPAEVVQRLNEETVKAARQPLMREKLASFGSDDVTNSPEAFRQFIAAETQKWSAIVKAADIRLEG